MASPSSSSTSASLQRGRACVSCRRRKMRCDGQRPVCGQCYRANRADDCEYTDGQGRTRTQMLEENIARLEARIQELEHPEEATSSINLFDPYSASAQGSSSMIPTYVSSLDWNDTGYSPSVTSSPVASEYLGFQKHALPLIPVSSGSSASSTSSHPVSPPPIAPAPVGLPAVEAHDTWWTSDEPPCHVLQQLVNIFLPHAPDFGFFLNIPRFHNAAVLPAPLGHPDRPSPAILSAVYLWAIFLSRSEHLLAQESVFLSRALHHTARGLSGNHPHRVLHTIQAEILLTYYFFSKGRFLEGKYHSSAAVGLAVSCGLHKIRSDRHTLPVYDYVGLGDTGFELPPPRDAIEEGERINGFWTVFALEKCWSVALKVPSVGLHFSQIDTPWPLDMKDYEKDLLPPDLRGHATLERFIEDSGQVAEADTSNFAAYVKASFLFERASHLAARWEPNMSEIDGDAFYADFLSLDSFTSKFISTLPRIDQERDSPNTVRSLLLARTLARVAAIQLHRIFSHNDARSNVQCLEAAMAVTGLMDLQDLSPLNPIVGTLWMSVSLVFIGEISRLKAYRAAWAPGVSSPGEDAYMASLDRAVVAMATYAQTCPLMRYQFTRIRDAYAAL